MKNELNYYYNLNPTSIHQVNKNYRCYVNNEEYLLMLCEKNDLIINEIYELSNYLLERQIPCHQLILNNSHQIITFINNQPYVLLKVFIKNRSINTDDLLMFSIMNINFNIFPNLVKSDWYDMWIKKIDYFEYQVSQFGKKYPIIRESFNFYIGLAENGISLFKNIYRERSSSLVVSHNRIQKNEGLVDLYNPLNFILDNKIRDLSEYIKEQFFTGSYSVEDVKIDMYKWNLNSYEYGLLFSRLLFPTYYFDCYEKILFDQADEKELLKIINKNKQYCDFLCDLFFYLKSFVLLPEIEWLIKK